MAALFPADDLAIAQLYARYNHAIHEGSVLDWVACFTPYAVFSNARARYAGHDDLAAYADTWIRDGGVRYWLNNLVVEPSADGATGECYLLILTTPVADAPAGIQLTGRYTDTLAVHDGAWKFASRHIARD